MALKPHNTSPYKTRIQQRIIVSKQCTPSNSGANLSPAPAFDDDEPATISFWRMASTVWEPEGLSPCLGSGLGSGLGFGLPYVSKLWPQDAASKTASWGLKINMNIVVCVCVSLSFSVSQLWCDWTRRVRKRSLVMGRREWWDI